MAPDEAGLATPERILEHAERLFIERGFAATSLRALTAGAEVNLAAVHYHFGSKEGLFQAVIHRRMAPVNQERTKRLDELEARVSAATLSVEEILDAFLAPVFSEDLSHELPSVARLMGRLHGEPLSLVLPILRREFGALGRRFLNALARALPEVPLEELTWRFHLTIGAMIVAVTFERPVIVLPEAPPPDEPLQKLVERLVRYAAAGLRDAATKETRS